MRAMACLLLMLLAAPTFAACPPPGHDLAALRALKTISSQFPMLR